MAPKNNPCGVSTLQKQKLLQPRPQGQAQPRTQGITFAHPLLQARVFPNLVPGVFFVHAQQIWGIIE